MSRFLTRTGTNSLAPWPTTIVPGLWLEPRRMIIHSNWFLPQTETFKLHFSQDLSRFSGPSRPVPVFTAVDRPRQSCRLHPRGEPLIFFLEENISYFYD